MTVVEDYSVKALNEVVTMLERRVNIAGTCQVGKRRMRALLKQRFDVTGQTAGNLLMYVLGYLVGRGILSLSNEHGTAGENTVYNISAAALRSM